MKKYRVITGIVILALVLSGCAKAATSSQNTRDSMEMPLYAAGAPEMEAPSPAMDQSKSTGMGVNASEPAFEQMIIMNADLSIAVDDPGVAMGLIQKMAADMGGFTVSSNLYKAYTGAGIEVPEANITVRVPAERLDEALDKIKALTGDIGKYVLTENVSGQDVTQQYTDLKSRLRNLEEANTKLSEFYENATKTEDALAIYNQKMQVTEQIEVIKGQMQYYEKSAAKSAISVRIQAKETIAPITVAGWQPSGVARDALQSLIDFGKGLVNFLIWLGILIVPILLVIGLPIYFIIRAIVRRNRRKQASRPQSSGYQSPQEPKIGSKPPLPPMEKK